MIKALFLSIILFVVSETNVLAQNSAAIDYLNSGAKKINLGKDTAGAIADFKKSIQLDSAGLSAYLCYSIIYCMHKNYDQALYYLNKGIKAYPNASELYGNRGNIKALQKNYQEAILDYKKVTELNPLDALSFLNLGNLEHNSGNYSAALKDFTRAIELDSRNPIIYVRRSDTKDVLKDYGGAIKDAEQSIALDPTYAEAYYTKANAEYHSGLKEAACANWKKSLTMGFYASKRQISSFCK